MKVLGYGQGFALRDSTGLISDVKSRLGELASYGTVIPDATKKVLYRKLCNEYKTAPIDVFKKLNHERTELRFENYALNEQQAKPLSLIIPYLSRLNTLTLKQCNLSDASAAIII